MDQLVQIIEKGGALAASFNDNICGSAGAYWSISEAKHSRT
jgi:hypothetical protein